MIAHRLSTITNADCIYVLENAHMWHQYNQSVKWKVQKGDEE